ncbi:hypothetical protein GCM10027567_31190 [Spongiibacter taiwanensis]
MASKVANERYTWQNPEVLLTPRWGLVLDKRGGIKAHRANACKPVSFTAEMGRLKIARSGFTQKIPPEIKASPKALGDTLEQNATISSLLLQTRLGLW